MPNGVVSEAEIKLPAANPPNVKHLNEWVESQITPMLRQIARKIVSHLNHVSFEKFLAQLKETITDFHAKTNDKPYVILLAEERMNKLFREGCSDVWVADLAFEYANLREPVAILNLCNYEAYLEENPNIKHVLVLDDAAYSGTQKSRAMDSFFRATKDYDNFNVYMGLIYLSAFAKKAIQESSDAEGLHFLKHGHMPSIMEAFDASEKSYIARLKPYFIEDAITLTYFDHTYPDYMSAYDPIYRGTNLFPMTSLGTMMGALGYGIDEHWNTRVDQVMPNRSARTGYTIPKIKRPYDKRMDISGVVNEQSYLPFQSTSMTEEQQRKVDSCFNQIPSRTLGLFEEPSDEDVDWDRGSEGDDMNDAAMVPVKTKPFG